MSKTLLIDGDLIVYAACAACERDLRWDDGFHTLHSDESEAYGAVQSGIRSLMNRFDTEDHVIALTTSPNFRHSIDPTYKSNRKGNRKPLAFSAVMDMVKADYRTAAFPGLEADDVLGIFATRDKDTILCSVDKDMKSIPCTLWDGKKVQRISEVDADWWHMTQTMVGDTTDGYPGCPGVGPKKAEKIIQDAINREAHLCSTVAQCVWEDVVTAFEKAGLTADDAVKQARLARILRDCDWDSEAKAPILWSPPT